MADLVQFDTQEEVVADVCGLVIKIPTFSFGFVLPPIPALPELPIPFFGFELSCDPRNPINVTAGLDYGGGRIPNYDPNPDLDDT